MLCTAGVLSELQRLGIAVPGETLMAGASAGSLAIATFNSGLSCVDALSAFKSFAANCRKAGTAGRLRGLLHNFLHEYLPSDAHQHCSNTCHISLTKLLPRMQREVVSQFPTKSDLVAALLASSHIPSK